MSFDELVETCRAYVASNGQTTKPIFSEQWSQGRTAFGGLSAGLLLAASEQKVASDKEMYSVYTSFIGPLLADVPFEIEVSILREGKNVVQVLSKAIQNEQVAVLQQACYGAKRESKIAVDHIAKHHMVKPEKPSFMDGHLEMAPNFVRNFELNLASGGEPFSNSGDTHTHGWMRFKQTPSAITNAHIMCLIDTWPPTVAQQLSRPVPLSTMSWYLEFINPNAKCEPSDWLAYQCDASYARGGYGYTDAYIWSGNGEIIAKSHQTITVFD